MDVWSDTTRIRSKLARRLLPLLFTTKEGPRCRTKTGVARQILDAVHQIVANELPLHCRLHQAFDGLDGPEQRLLVGQLESATHDGLSTVGAGLSDLRDHCRGPFFAQEGEDLILSDLFPVNYRGYYVDVGAHHPYRFSNTAYFFLRGWMGINVDAAPGTAAIFSQARPQDITVECAVGEQEGAMDFFLFDEPALNTLEPERVRQLELETSYRVKETRRLPVRRLESILVEHLPAGQMIDFLSVDVEGHELSVVKSNDWHRFRPKIVLLELLGRSLLELGQDPVVQAMQEVRYEPIAKGPRTVFFKDTTA